MSLEETISKEVETMCNAARFGVSLAILASLLLSQTQTNSLRESTIVELPWCLVLYVVGGSPLLTSSAQSKQASWI